MKNKTLKAIIAMADELNPNSYSNNIKAQWVNEVESYIQTEIYNVAPLDVVSYIDYEESKDKELSLDAVNDKIYLVYLQAMIDFFNKEYQAFNNDVALYNSYLDIYAKWYVRTHGEGKKLISGMYLSAYGIAVKNGFTGTEEEWVLSLKGERGEKGDKGDKGDAGANGKDGVGIDDIITSYTPVGSGATNVDIYLTDGRNKMFTVNDGYTPIKGIDYWTEEDKKEIISEIPKGGTWELIDTIITTEDVKNVTVRNEPDGTPYNFKKLLVLIKNVTTGASGNAYVQVQGYQSAWSPSYYLLTHTNAMVYLSIEGNLAWAETHSGLGDYSQFHNYGKPIPIPGNTFNTLLIKGNGTILTGTTFEIWGVRNDENV